MTAAPFDGVFEPGSGRGAARAALATVEADPTAVEAVGRGNRKRTAVARFAERDPVVVQVCAEPAWLRTEAALLRAVGRRTDVPVPAVLAAGTHEGAGYTLTAHVAGDDLHAAFTAVDGETRRALARWFGTALARLHEAFRFEGYGRLTLEDGTLRAERDDWGRWFRAYGRRAIDRLPAAFDPLRAALRAAVDSVPDPGAAPRLFPWDFRPGNALLEDGSVTAVLDWEAPLAAPPALSAAKAEYLLADWYVADPDPLRRAFRDGYRDVRAWPSVRPAHRVAAVAESAVDSTGTVTNPRYPPVDREAAVAFHRAALEEALSA